MTNEPLLKAEGISKIYSQGALAVGLHRFSAAFHRGEFVAITGSSGSGKSTLLNILSGLDSYDEGELYFRGEPTSHYTEEDRAAYRKDNVAFIFQDYNILDSYTVYQNIELALLYSMPDPVERKARIQKLIDAVGLTGREKQRCSKLSGGQKQRVSIARALAKDAPILFADEPCGNLDSTMTDEVMKLLHDLSQDKLVIIVTHSYDEVAPYATRKIRLADGELVEDQVFREVDLPAEDVPPAAITKKQVFKGLLTVAVNNIKATPKRSFFGIFGLTILTTIFIVGVLVALKLTELPDFNEYYRYDLQVQKYDKSAITDEELADIAAVKGVSEVYRDNIYLNKTCGNYVAGNYVLTYLRPCTDISQSRLYSGRLPENDREIVLSVPESRKYLQRTLLETSVKVDLNGNYNDTAPEFTVVGVVAGDSAAYVTADFFRKDACLTENADECLTVVTKSDADLSRVRTALHDKGYCVFHLYGDKASQGVTGIINLLIVLALFGMMIIVFRIIMGSYRALETSKRRDYNIMRTVGLPNGFVKSIYYVEMVMQGLIGWACGVALTIIIGLVYGFSLTPKITYGMQVLGKFGLNLLWIAVVALLADVFVTIGNAYRFNKYFYRQTVKMSLKEGGKHD